MDEEDKTEIPVSEPPSRWQLIRDLAAFQLKLAMDGIRDVLLSPVSLIATIVGLIISPDNPGKYFNQLLAFGRRSDVWINLFGASEHYQQDASFSSSDAYIKKLEDLLKQEYRRGGVVTNLKNGTDHLMNQIHKDANKPGE